MSLNATRDRGVGVLSEHLRIEVEAEKMGGVVVARLWSEGAIGVS